MAGYETYNLIVPRRSDSEVLMMLESDRYSLPSVSIMRNSRHAQQITAEAKRLWGLTATCRANDSIFDPGRSKQYQVIDPCESKWMAPATLRWVLRSRIDTTNCATEEVEMLGAAFRVSSNCGPFALSGWMEDLQTWLEPHLSAHGAALTGRFEQFNASEFFSLIRFETTSGAVWFKAVGKPNLLEYSITAHLANRYPHFLPRIIATRAEWHAWLMEESGSSLRDHMELREWTNAARTLGLLQQRCVQDAAELLALGCRDMRTDAVLSGIEPIVDLMSALMSQQINEPPNRLAPEQLAELGRQLRVLCLQLQECGIPDSILHGDFSPGSILVMADRCVFTDWAEAYIGHPFITFEHMLAHLRRVHLECGNWENELRRAYADCWSPMITLQDCERAFALVRPLAILNYALAIRGRIGPDRFADVNVVKLFRSLARSMYREVSNLKARGDVCTV